jgi:DMSO reductase family type II enzyme heme b subunit
MRSRGAVLLVCVIAAPRLAAAAPASPAQLEAGKKTYERDCAQCHGDKGDGQGPAAPHLMPPPRDFTAGKFKLRTTPSGALPTDDDLRRVIRNGMPYTSMPAWPDLTDEEVANVIRYIKTFQAGFADLSQTAKPIELPRPPASSGDSVQKGRQLYTSLGCVRCHGEAGRGEGPSAPTLKDDAGHPLRAADLTYRWTFRGGPRREDIFRTFSTGLNGTPMPSFFDSLKPEERWQLTDYVYSLGDSDTPSYATLLVAATLDDEVDVSRGTALFDAAPSSRFPIVGQIMEPGRDFAPSATAVEVRAVFGQQRIAFLVRWHDIHADTTGQSSPVLEVPLSEEEPAPPAPAPAAGGSDFWGEEAQAPAAAPTPAPSAAVSDFWGEASAPSGPVAAASEFSDAVAIQLPAQLPEGIAKPYFLFGDAQRPVDLWFLDLATQRVRQYVGRGSASLTALEASEVEASASYARGEWSAIFVRDLRSTAGVSFAEGQYVPIAFSVWDGLARERGNRRGLTQWFYVYLRPREKPSVVGPMGGAGLGVLALEILAVYWIRRKGRAAATTA